MLRLRRYQHKTIKQIGKFKGRALLALDMGTGKTITSLVWAFKNDKLPAVVVCPASVKWQWQDEAWKHAGLSSIVATGRSPKGKGHIHTKDIDLFIINYDILPGWIKWIDKNIKPKTIILDECHYCKNQQAKRTKAVKKLCKKISHVLALSGTPLTSRPNELFPIINILSPKQFPSFTDFSNTYCKRRKTPWGWKYTGAKNLNRLNKLLLKYNMIRLRKEDVLKELPDKEIQVIPVEMICRLEYLKKESRVKQWLQRQAEQRQSKVREPEAQSKMLILKQTAAKLKLKSVFNWIDDFLAESDEKLVVFAWHKEIVRKINERYNCAIITGETPPEERKKEIRKFNKNPKCRIFCGNIKAAGTGVNGLQTASSNVVFIELPWTSADLNQAIDRLHRIGQNHKVHIRLLVARDTIEHDLVRILQSKHAIFSETLDGRASKELNVFDQLMHALKKRKR